MERLVFMMALAMGLATAVPAEDRAEGNGKGKSLVVFFSKTNTTRTFAEEIQRQVGGDIFEVVPKNPYPADYRKTTEIARAEQDDAARPELVATMSPEEMDGYDTVFIGYPIWWGMMPMVMLTFLEQFDLAGKTVVPFCTHGGSSIIRSRDAIIALYKDATVRQGLCLSSSALDSQSRERITEWLRQVGMIK